MPKQRSTKLAAVRVAGRLLDRAAPASAAAFAERIFFRLPPSTPRARRLPPDDVPVGRLFAVDHDGKLIRGTSWGTGPTVYLVHGWGGWGLQLGAFVGRLVASGFQVVTYDALSHGRSSAGRWGPKMSDPLEATASLHAVGERFGPADAVIAHSMGAIVTAHAIHTGFSMPRRLVFVAAANNYQPSLDQLTRFSATTHRTHRHLLSRIERRLGLPFSYFDVAGIFSDILAERGMLPSLLAVHDRDDREMPFAGSLTISEGWPSSRLVLTHNLGHRRILTDPSVGKMAATFIASGTETTLGHQL